MAMVVAMRVNEKAFAVDFALLVQLVMAMAMEKRRATATEWWKFFWLVE